MRLWHKDLIPVLPDKQLLGQWRECCAIAKNIAEKGTPNHLLVNKIMDYSIGHFYIYSEFVYLQMLRRGFRCNFGKFHNLIMRYTNNNVFQVFHLDDIFADWHNDRYYVQCFFNLQEKYDCGGISKDEWEKIHNALIERCLKRKDWTFKCDDFPGQISAVEVQLQ